MRKMLIKAMTAVQAGAVALSLAVTGTSVYAKSENGMWLKGDYHTHTYLSDGSYTASEVAAKAKQFGLDWYSAADHGGGSKGQYDQNGNAWAADTANLTGTIMPRWATISGVGEDEINNNRKTIMQISGLEWNVPTHEHASVGIIGDSTLVKNSLAIFDYIYDGSKEAYNSTNSLFAGIERAMDGKTEASGSASKFTYNTHNGAVAGARYLEANFPTTSYFLPNHPSRNLSYTAADFREFNDEAPDVCFGAELLPGHQASAFRGGYSYMNVYDSILKKTVNIAGFTGNTISAKLQSYIASLSTAASYTDAIKAAMLTSLQSNILKQRTYGGADYMLAKVGGVWDTLLSEGRHFWAFGNSDFHIDEAKVEANKAIDSNYSGEPDFWPGEYSKNYTYVTEKSYQGILNGMRSGNSYAVLGDLIKALDYTISNNTTSATMGETIIPINGKDTTVTIRFKSPAENNNGATPVVDHIDLIAGVVTGIPETKYVDSSKTSLTSFEDPKQYLTAAYQTESVTTTKVIKTFNKADFKTDSEGYQTVTFTLPGADKDMYYRLRGTNNAVGTVNVDANGNPTIDTDAEAVTGTNTAATAYSDLWFYSNPIFVNAPVNGVTVNAAVKNANGTPLANTNVRIDENKAVLTDASGKVTFHNLKKDIHTLYILDSAGNVTSQFTFKLQDGDKTEFDLGDVWISSGITEINLSFNFSGSDLSIASVSNVLAVTPVKNPVTGELGGNIIIYLIASVVILMAAAIKVSLKKSEVR